MSEIVIAFHLSQLPKLNFGTNKKQPLELAAIIMTIMGDTIRFVDKPSDFDEHPTRIAFKTRKDAEYFFDKFWFQRPMSVVGPLVATANKDNTHIWDKFCEIDIENRAVFVTTQNNAARTMEIVFVVEREKALELKLKV